MRNLLVPLAVVAVLGAIGGYLVTRQFGVSPAAAHVRLSVVGLDVAATPRPTPSQTPSSSSSSSSSSEVHVRIRGRSGGSGGGGGGGGNCPSGCECNQQPNGVIIQCH